LGERGNKRSDMVLYVLQTAYYGKKQRRANAGTRDIGTINSKNRIAATTYSLWTLFVSGIYV
jgi:hypothetical protein